MRILIISLALLVASGCASKKANEEMTEAEYFTEARESLDRKAFLNAIDGLEELEARFPYGDFAEQAQLDLIYARYRSLDYPGAAAQADRFVRSYPASSAVDYALYLKGLANYHQNAGLFARFTRSQADTRDLNHMREAFAAFDQLVRRFPESDYAADARSRMLFIREKLAAQELVAARYYARRKAFIAAANRAQLVVRHYQGTPHVEEALAIMSKAYQSLEQPGLANKSSQVLARNWPDSNYLDSAGQIEIEWWPASGNRSWLSLITFDLL